jgi:hypothetical protein
MGDNWKANQVADTFNAFFSQFGQMDQNSRVVLEIIFEELLNGRTETLLISSEKRQNGD